MKSITALVDIDYVTAELHSEWLCRYNRDFNDCLTVSDITEWDIHKFVKAECGMKIYDYIKDPSIYDSVQIVAGAKFGIYYLRYILQARVVFLTSGINIGKLKFLQRYNLIQHERNIVVAHDKSLVRGDVMIDDNYENIKAFHSKNPMGLGILYNAPHNKLSPYNVRANNWYDAVMLLKEKFLEWENDDYTTV